MSARANADVIHAYADGGVPQWRYLPNLGGVWVDWNATNGPPLFSDSVEWRIKPPEPVKLRYRIGELRNCNGGPNALITATTENSENYWQAERNFIKWRTDWIEIEATQ